MGTKRVLVVSNYAFDNTTDLYRLLKKIKNDLQALPSYIDYVTYKGNDFLEFITTKYSQGYRIIIGDFYSSQCLSVFDFLTKHNDLLLISSASTSIFTKQMPYNLIRLLSNDEMTFSLFKDSILDSMNNILLTLDPTLLLFPRQKEIINLNDKTFVKTVNVLYTDEDIYNLSYVRMIKRTITGNESYKFKFYKINSAIISQNKLTPEASTILKTTDKSNVFMIITTSYPQQFLNILSSKYEYGIQIIFFNDSFVSPNFIVKSQLPYAYTLINTSHNNLVYYQRLLFNNYAGYINHYTLEILQFLRRHTELMNKNIIDDLSTNDMIDLLKNSNEYINGQPINHKCCILEITFTLSSLNINIKTKRKNLRSKLFLCVSQLKIENNISLIRDLRDLNTIIDSGYTKTFNVVKSLKEILSTADLTTYVSYINVLYYIYMNPLIFPTNNILKLLDFKGTDAFNDFIIIKQNCSVLNNYLWNFYNQLTEYDSNTSVQDNEIININVSKKEYFTIFLKFISNIIEDINY